VQICDHATQMRALFSICVYSLFSSCLLVINKAAMLYFPLPNALFSFQLIFGAVGVKVVQSTGLVTMSPWNWKTARAFLPAVLLFFSTTWSNFIALYYVNVDTVVAFRSSTPLLVALGDYVFLGMQLPTTRTWISLIGVASSVTYAFWRELILTSEAWLACLTYFVLISSDMLYLKKVISDIPMTTFERVLYQNSLSLFLSVPLALYFESNQLLLLDVYSFRALLFIALSSSFGFGIGWAGWNLRAQVSALSFTVVGVLNKLASIIINTLAWKYHASPSGLLAITLSVLASSLYQPPAKRIAGG